MGLMMVMAEVIMVMVEGGPSGDGNYGGGALVMVGVVKIVVIGLMLVMERVIMVMVGGS